MRTMIGFHCYFFLYFKNFRDKKDTAFHMSIKGLSLNFLADLSAALNSRFCPYRVNLCPDTVKVNTVLPLGIAKHNDEKNPTTLIY